MPEYRTPGIYIEEISAGPRPVQAAATTDTGFTGVITLPKSFLGGTGIASGMYVPDADELPQLTWSRALAFRGLLGDSGGAAADSGGGKDDKGKKPPAKPASGNKLQSLVDDLLEGSWAIDAPNGGGSIILTSDKGMKMKVPARSSLVSVIATDKGDKEWDLAFGADELQMTQLIASSAVSQGVKHTGNLACVDPKKKVTIDVEAIQDALQGTAPAITSMDGYTAWRTEFGEKLAVQILLQSNKNLSPEQAGMLWDTMPGTVKASWDKWLRSHPGMARFEIALAGFFGNGGRTAYPAMAVQAAGAAGPAKRQFLEDSFDGVQNCAMLCAPGLEFAWQQAILEYAGPAGRGDLFAILETPRHMFTKEPRGTKLTKFRWTDVSHSPYEMATLDTVPSPEFTELRYGGFSADELLDRAVPRDESGYGAAYGPWLVVENPLSTGPADKFVIAPPAGHVAGVIAATDLKPGGGVHKAPANEQVLGVTELVTQISDREQAALNPKGINIIRRRPMAGIRIWGARTIASDPLWNYVNVRRLFLFVERSVRDALNWAVFLPNTDATRKDLKSTIAAFLYSLWSQGMLDGATWQEAFTVRCDRSNNPDVDVRSGLLTIDVELRPVYPAEFIRIRFRQSPMRSEVTEG